MSKATGRDRMRLRPSARLQKYLGRELIADPNLAIIEFIKNAYDAGAARVIVEFDLKSEPSSLTVTDDGTGMDEAAFRVNWLSPGFSSKSPEYDGPSTVASEENEAANRAKERSPAGEKGLGRLASGRLGDVMEVWTRPSQDQTWLHVTFDWASFEDMSVYMDQVSLPYDNSPPEDPQFPSGTIVRISGLRQNWSGRVPGRPIPGRKRTRLGRLKQDLELLVRPFGGRTTEFSVDLRSNAYLDSDDIGAVLASEGSTSADYTYEFIVALDDADYVTVAGDVTRSPAIVEELGLPAHEKVPPLTVNKAVAREQQRPETLGCGFFTGTFFYTPPPKAKRATEIASTGVLLYRDGILVEPYGLPGNDWVGVAARKASRQGHAAIQPATFSGYIQISRRHNPELEEMSNRMGLLESDASEDFIGHVRAEFARFEDRVYEELVTKRWESQEAKATKAAGKAEALARVRTRALAHSMGQPMTAIAFEALRLEVIGQRKGVPAEVREELTSVQSRIEVHLNRMGGITRKFADLRVPEFETVSTAALVSSAVVEVQEFATLSSTSINVGELPESECLVPPELIVDSLIEVLTNAIEVPRDDGVEPEVVITATSDERLVWLTIDDNGRGFPDGVPEDFENVPSTSGRPPEGLATVDNAMNLANGSVRIESTGPSGTSIVIGLPRRNTR